MEGKRFQTRVRGILLLLAVVLMGFVWVLYDLQYVHGEDYLEQSRRRIAKTETVEAARGEILDRYGRVLVSNRTGYNVSLDTSFMGEERNQILLELLAICREEGVAWSDSLPVSGEALADLFQMTPYYWKTPKTGAQRLATLDALEVTAAFRIHVFRRL